MEIVNNGGNSSAELGILQRYANLLDSSIRIPGTKRTIGLDPILGLIPVVGPLLGYAFSVALLFKTIKLGPSKRLVMKMFGNALLDAVLGSIPVLGILFDFTYKANERNMKLFNEYHQEGKHRESTLPIFLFFLALSGVLVLLLTWGLYKLMVWVF